MKFNTRNTIILANLKLALVLLCLSISAQVAACCEKAGDACHVASYTGTSPKCSHTSKFTCKPNSDDPTAGTCTAVTPTPTACAKTGETCSSTIKCCDADADKNPLTCDTSTNKCKASTPTPTCAKSGNTCSDTVKCCDEDSSGLSLVCDSNKKCSNIDCLDIGATCPTGQKCYMKNVLKF